MRQKRRKSKKLISEPNEKDLTKINLGFKKDSRTDEESADFSMKSSDQTFSPYLNQLHLYFEKSLLEDEEMDDAHHLSEFLLKHPEFYPEIQDSDINETPISDKQPKTNDKTRKSRN